MTNALDNNKNDSAATSRDAELLARLLSAIASSSSSSTKPTATASSLKNGMNNNDVNNNNTNINNNSLMSNQDAIAEAMNRAAIAAMMKQQQQQQQQQHGQQYQNQEMGKKMYSITDVVTTESLVKLLRMLLDSQSFGPEGNGVASSMVSTTTTTSTTATNALSSPSSSSGSIRDRLMEHLPETHRSLETMIKTIQSPQFRQQVDSFSKMICSGQIEWAQLGLRNQSGNGNGRPMSVLELLSAIDDEQRRLEMELRERDRDRDRDVV